MPDGDRVLKISEVDPLSCRQPYFTFTGPNSLQKLLHNTPHGPDSTQHEPRAMKFELCDTCHNLYKYCDAAVGREPDFSFRYRLMPLGQRRHSQGRWKTPSAKSTNPALREGICAIVSRLLNPGERHYESS